MYCHLKRGEELIDMDKKQWAMLNEKKKLLKGLFPDLPAKSGIYKWFRVDEETYKGCVYVGKAKNILERSAQHLLGNESHLDKSIKKHGLQSADNPHGWRVYVLELTDERNLDVAEQWYIDFIVHNEDVELYNVESGGTKGKTIIGERKQRRDIVWRKKEREKVFSELREWFDLTPLDCTVKKDGTLYANAERLKHEFYKVEK